MKNVSKLLIATMLAFGVTSIAAAGEVDPADCKAAPAGDKTKPRQKVAPGSAQQPGEISAADCKATVAGKSDKTRKEVKADTKAAAKAGEIKYGETSGKK